MPIGLSTRHGRTVSLEQGADPGASRCPACGEPLFAWVETSGYGRDEDLPIDHCESCGLVIARDAVPTPDEAVAALLTAAEPRDGRVLLRTENAASLQAWLGSEHWAALRPGRPSLVATPRAVSLLLARRGLEVRRVRHLAGAGMASMWQTLLNLLTFHRNFASEAASRRLRPGTGWRRRAAYWIDAVVTVLAAVPAALIAVLLEGGAVLAGRGGVVEVEAEQLPSTD